MDKGTYLLTQDFETSVHTDPLHAGRTVRDINLVFDDRRIPDIVICRVYSSRADAEIILAALTQREND